MKAYGGVDVQMHVFLTSALVQGEWSASHPSCFTPGERAPSTHWIGGWADPKAGLDNMEKLKSLTYHELNSHPSVIQPIAGCYTDYTTMALG
jgi:hypothetical protein